MDTRLLRASRRFPDGTRTWVVPGQVHPIKMIPSRGSYWGVISLSWPHSDGRQSVRLDWHRTVAKRAVAPLFQQLSVGG